MTEALDPAPTGQPELVTPATEGLAGLLAAAAEQTLASMSAEAFSELVQRVRPPDEPQPPAPPVLPRGDQPPPRMPRVPADPTPDQTAAMERYSSEPYPAHWIGRRQESK